MEINTFIIKEHDGFQVVRDDLFDGGTKYRVFSQIASSFEEKEFVYAADHYGYAAYAVARAALNTKKKVMLFYPEPKKETDIFLKTTCLPNVIYEVVKGAQTQIEVSKEARSYALKKGAKFLDIGLDFPLFVKELSVILKTLKFAAPEIWCMGGSGALARALKKAYPEIPVKVVSVGTNNANFLGVDQVYQAPEDLHQEACMLPNYPSCTHYDAKVWRFVQKYAQPNALIWNVAP